jgi:hypothetical protein
MVPDGGTGVIQKGRAVMGYWNDNEVKKTKDDHIELEQLESECLDELGDVEKSFRERMGAENKRFKDMCDTEYWCCICFTSRAQKEEFLESLEFDGDLKYIEGKEFARAVKRPVKTEDLRFARIGKGSKEYLGRLIDEQK